MNALKKLIESELKKQLGEQYRTPSSPSNNMGWADDSETDPQKNLDAMGLVSQKILKLTPKQQFAVKLELSRHFASQAEDSVGLLDDEVAETLMFLDTEPQKSVKYAIQNVPNDIFIDWLTKFKKVFDEVVMSMPDKQPVK